MPAACPLANLERRMAKRDYYEALGLPRNATEAELKTAYRRLAMKFHPDRNPGDAAAEASFKEIKEAWEVLKDPRKRAAYDQFGHAGLGGEGPGGGGFGGGEAFSDIFGEVFGDIFGSGRRSRSRVYRGADLRYEVELELEQAAFGDTVTISLPLAVECTVCHGSGAKPCCMRTAPRPPQVRARSSRIHARHVTAMGGCGIPRRSP